MVIVVSRERGGGAVERLAQVQRLLATPRRPADQHAPAAVAAVGRADEVPHERQDAVERRHHGAIRRDAVELVATVGDPRYPQRRHAAPTGSGADAEREREVR